MQVRERMSAPAVTISSDTDYRQALQMMQGQGVHHLPVLNEHQHLVGIITERDLLLAAARYMNTPLEVEEIMQKVVVTIDPEASVAEAAVLLVSNKIGGLPVVDSMGYVVGVITETDLLHSFVEMLGEGLLFARDMPLD